jgi:hypothetical protein
MACQSSALTPSASFTSRKRLMSASASASGSAGNGSGASAGVGVGSGAFSSSSSFLATAGMARLKLTSLGPPERTSTRWRWMR